MKLAKTLGWPLGGKGDHPRLATEPAGFVSLGFGFLNPNPTGTILVGTDLLVPGWAIIGEEDSEIHYFWWPWHVNSTWSSLPAHLAGQQTIVGTSQWSACWPWSGCHIHWAKLCCWGCSSWLWFPPMAWKYLFLSVWLVAGSSVAAGDAMTSRSLGKELG